MTKILKVSFCLLMESYFHCSCGSTETSSSLKNKGTKVAAFLCLHIGLDYTLLITIEALLFSGNGWANTSHIQSVSIRPRPFMVSPCLSKFCHPVKLQTTPQTKKKRKGITFVCKGSSQDWYILYFISP